MTKATNIKKFWKAFAELSIAKSRMTKDNLPHCVLKPDGTLTSNQQETVQAWQHHFRQIFNPPTGDEAHRDQLYIR